MDEGGRRRVGLRRFGEDQAERYGRCVQRTVERSVGSFKRVERGRDHKTTTLANLRSSCFEAYTGACVQCL